MQPEFKKHEKVRLLMDADPDKIEYDLTHENAEKPIKKGAIGKINMLLPNGEFHVEIIDNKGKTIAYVVVEGSFLEKVDE